MNTPASSQTSSASAPRLSPPGAGLPALELFFARLMVGWKSNRTSRAESESLFASERDAILRIVASCDAATLAKQVLIKRLRGLEDSSRFWSVLMTLDHLRIVNRQISGVIAGLSKGQLPPKPASTAAVKPSETVDASVVQDFEAACEEFRQVVGSIDNLATPVKFAHPWFGHLDGAGWHFMAAFHMRLHRQQIEAILEKAAVAS